MMRIARFSIVALGALALSACLGGGGKKVPPTLLTLTSSAPAPESINRSSAPGETIMIDVPVIPKELATTRVPAQVGPSAVAYIQDLQWVESPDRLFQDLVQETVMRTTNRVVLDPRQAGFDPGMRLGGTLSRFGYDAQEGMVIVRYDAALAVPGGTQVQTRRFEAREAADGTASTVGPALNAAANRVATDVAQWVGGS
jgi:cholesterol transport system auxiliary component